MKYEESEEIIWKIRKRPKIKLKKTNKKMKIKCQDVDGYFYEVEVPVYKDRVHSRSRFREYKWEKFWKFSDVLKATRGEFRFKEVSRPELLEKAYSDDIEYDFGIDYDENDLAEVLERVAARIKELQPYIEVPYLEIAYFVYDRCRIRMSHEVALKILKLCHQKMSTGEWFYQNSNINLRVRKIKDTRLRVLMNLMSLDENITRRLKRSKNKEVSEMAMVEIKEYMRNLIHFNIDKILCKIEKGKMCKDRKCLRCKNVLHFTDFIKTNLETVHRDIILMLEGSKNMDRNHIEERVTYLLKLWNSPYIELACCDCQEFIGRKYNKLDDEKFDKYLEILYMEEEILELIGLDINKVKHMRGDDV